MDVQTASNIVTVRTGGSGSVDYEITAPAWLPIKASGQYLYVGVEGAQNEVSAETVRGDIEVRGSGFVTAKSIHGQIILEDAKGRISASSVNEAIRITGSSSEITAEDHERRHRADEGGREEPRGRCGQRRHPVRRHGIGRRTVRFATHNGNITMVVPENTNATFTVRTYNGEFSPDGLPVKAVGELRRGRRATYVLGNGGADIDLESFSGSIRLRRPGAVPTRGKDRDKEEKDR